MIRLILDGHVVATGPDWMFRHFIEDAVLRFPDLSFTIQEVKE